MVVGSNVRSCEFMCLRYLLTLPITLGLVAASAGNLCAAPAGGRFASPGSEIAYCPQAPSFLTRTSGLSLRQKLQYVSLICRLAAKGTLAKLDGLYRLAAPNRAASLLNLAQSKYDLTVNGTMRFGPNAGWIGDGSTGFLATGFTPSTAGGRYKLGSSSLGVVINDPRQANSSWASIGALITRIDGDYIAIGNNGNFGRISGTSCGSTGPPTTNGTWIWTYNNSTVSCYLNGTSLATASGSPTALLNAPIVVGGLSCIGCNGSNVIGQTGDTLTWAFFGGGLTTTDIANLTQAFAAFPAITAPVPAAFWGYTAEVFNYNFAARGLSGIDVNATLNPGFSLYTAWWFGVRSAAVANQVAPPASTFSYSGGAIRVGSATNAVVLSTAGNTGSAFTATVSETTLTVTNVLYGPILAGQVVAGNAALSGQTILQQLTGPTGDVGTYQLSGSVTIARPAKLLGNSNVGTTFVPGGYYEVSMGYDPANDTGNNGFPSFWLIDIKGLQSANFNRGYGAAGQWVEWDVFEAKTGGRAADMNAFDWTNINGGQGANNLGLEKQIYELYPTVTNPTSQHLYGMLWVPSTKNAGTGLVQFYLDRVHIAGHDITYTSSAGASPACIPSNPNGCLFVSESGQFVALIDSGGGHGKSYPADLTSLNVWR